MSKKIKWSLVGAGVVILAGGGFVYASRSKDTPNGADQLPFRLGKVQAEDLQVSVREVGVVDPETKVDVKSSVSGRVEVLSPLGPRLAEGVLELDRLVAHGAEGR